MRYNFFTIISFFAIYLSLANSVLFSEPTDDVLRDSNEESKTVTETPINEDILNTLKYGTSSQKTSIISSIAKSKNHSEMDTLIKHYPNELNPAVKISIIKLFSRYNYESAKSIVSLALDDEDESVLKEAYNLSAIYPDAIFEKKLSESLEKETGSTQELIINTLGTMKSTLSSDYLVEIYEKEDTSGNAKVQILRYFSENGDIKGEEISKKAALGKNNAPFERYMGVIALGKYPSEENYKALESILKEDIPELSARVIYVLPAFKDYSDVKADIIEAAKNDNETVRLYAIKALKDYKTDSDVEDLLLYRLKSDNLESITLAILEINTDSLSKKMEPSIIELAESSNNAKLKNKARAVLDKHSVTYKK